ncbi:hypothetical protein QP172_04305 [Corynebacterium coyleae]|nr:MULTISPECIES: hypothetical protein [Corynebacterium]MDK6492952.1 hypothetical protein [Corynebacterium coyleae]
MTILVWALGTGATNVETRYRLMSESPMTSNTSPAEADIGFL